MNFFLNLLVNIFVPVAVKTVEKYVENTESKNDDKVLDVIKIGADYMAEKTNNDLTIQLAKELNETKMVKVQRSKLDIK